MDEEHRHEDRNDDRKRDASNTGNEDERAANRRHVDNRRDPRALTPREQQERWPIG